MWAYKNVVLVLSNVPCSCKRFVSTAWLPATSFNKSLHFLRRNFISKFGIQPTYDVDMFNKLGQIYRSGVRPLFTLLNVTEYQLLYCLLMRWIDLSIYNVCFKLLAHTTSFVISLHLSECVTHFALHTTM